MKTPDGFEQSYNAQDAVDIESHLLVGVNVSDAPNDHIPDEPQGTGFLCRKPVDAGVFLGDRLPHEDDTDAHRDLKPVHATKAGAAPLGRDRRYWTHLQAFDFITGERKWIAEAADEPQGTGFLCRKPVDAWVFLGDRLPHEDGEAFGGAPIGDTQFVYKARAGTRVLRHLASDSVRDA